MCSLMCSLHSFRGLAIILLLNAGYQCLTFQLPTVCASSL
uniref:Uncharacterized protein n=1 Tax=Setaria italica TaxID=4555 RepID=K4A476_SETIT